MTARTASAAAIRTGRCPGQALPDEALRTAGLEDLAWSWGTSRGTAAEISPRPDRAARADLHGRSTLQGANGSLDRGYRQLHPHPPAPSSSAPTSSESCGFSSRPGAAEVYADPARGDIGGFVVGQLQDHDAVSVVDETGDPKKDRHTVGIQHRYTGTAGRIENSDVAVYLACTTSREYPAIDRELHVPHSWLESEPRFRAAGVPDSIDFATNLARGR